MNAAMNVGVLCGVVTHGGVEHDPRLLTGGRVVEVNERFTMNFLFQSREIFPDFVNIKGDTALLLSFWDRPIRYSFHKVNLSFWGNRENKIFSSSVRMDSILIRLVISLAKA